MVSYDKENMKEVLEHFYQQIPEAITLAKAWQLKKPITKVMIGGMGGSALPGDLLQSYLHGKFPVYVVKDYQLPAYCDKTTALFLISYSGNTEETISLFHQAIKTKAQLITISSGGKLEQLAKKHKVPHIKVPSGIQPRSALGYQFFPVYALLKKAGVIKDKASVVKETITALQQSWFTEEGKTIARKLKGKIPLIYSSTAMRIVAEKWKINMNENAKIHAFFNVFPEFNHNEINGYVNKNGNYSVIILQDPEDHPRIKKRMKIIEGLVKKYKYPVHSLTLKGKEKLTRIFAGIHLSDWVSYWLALAYKTDPTPVPIIEDLKKQLKK